MRPGPVFPTQLSFCSAINVITRTGQNEFHGAAFTFFQNEWLMPASHLPIRFLKVVCALAVFGVGSL
jgi:hypothetical protein